jgi:hypothetical protein
MDITSANAVLTISPRSAGLIGSGGVFTVEGFASDSAFMGEEVDVAEARMGVDGKLSVGFTPYITKQTITLQADSPSLPLFEAIVGAQNALRQPMILDSVLALPSLQKAYIFTKGAMTRLTPFTPGKKVLEPMNYEISWETVAPAPLQA